MGNYKESLKESFRNYKNDAEYIREFIDFNKTLLPGRIATQSIEAAEEYLKEITA